jgi:hypothetical protein
MKVKLLVTLDAAFLIRIFIIRDKNIQLQHQVLWEELNQYY